MVKGTEEREAESLIIETKMLSDRTKLEKHEKDEEKKAKEQKAQENFQENSEYIDSLLYLSVPVLC